MSIAEFGTSADELASRTDATPSMEAMDAQRAYLKSQEKEQERTPQETSVESNMEAEIAPVVEEAKTINPEYAQNVEEEATTSARETLKMKIEGTVYGILTSVEKKIGQSFVMAQMKQELMQEAALAKSIRQGALEQPYYDIQGVLHEGIPRSEAKVIDSDIRLARKNLDYGRERVTFTPGGESLPRNGMGLNVKAEGPNVDLSYRSRTGKEPFSYINSIGATRAQIEIEYNPVIQTLERWRGDLAKKRQTVESIRQIVTSYNPVGVAA